MTQPNTKALRASQQAPAANSEPLKDLGNQGKQSSGGSSPGEKDNNPYFDDGMQHKTPRKKRTKTYHDQILDNWSDGGDEDPTDENKRNWFKSLFEMTGKENKTSFVHELLTASLRNIPHAAKGWLERLLLERPDLFGSENEWGILPITRAAKYLPDLVFLVFDLVIPETTRKMLEEHSANSPPCEACPLWDVSLALRDLHPLTEVTRKKDVPVTGTMPAVASDMTTPETQDDAKESRASRPCLHSRVNITELLDREKELRNSLKELLKVHAFDTLKLLLVANRFDPGYNKAQVIKLKSFRNILELSPSTIFTEDTHTDGHNLLQLAVGLLNEKSIDHDLQYSVIEALVQRSPESIFHVSKAREGKKNVYSLLGEMEKSVDVKTDRFDKVRNLIKLECIRYKGDGMGGIKPAELQAKQRSLLYGNGEPERKLSLNLMGEFSIIDEVYIKMVTSRAGMQLETVLASVRLPNWKPDGAKLYRSKMNEKAESDTLDAFHDPYVGIFKWLWDKCKVRKILTLEVDDSGPEPHTNAAIREALKRPEQEGDFGIEVWKWKKFDMHVATIVAAAPRAREVHLFSYGNIAVLEGWSCPSGLAKLTDLEKLSIKIYPKNEKDKVDCLDYKHILKERLTKHCRRLKESNISVIYPYETGTGGSETSPTTTATASPGPPSDRPKTKEWIAELKEYRQFIKNMGDYASREMEKPAPKVKVAILDDGAKLADLNGEQRGESFRADGQEYFVGPCKHGTEMAVCVREVCPEAELYIARLDDSQESEKGHPFTIVSCIKALKWALENKVDVISMSWTYERVDGNTNSEMDEFEQLVKDAVNGNKTVLFGSLPDVGPNQDGAKYYPVTLEGVIKISSATKAGSVSEDNLYQDYDFLLPGQDIRNSLQELVQGSSFATAYAAGLAALVIYSFRVLHAFNDIEGGDAEKALRAAKKSAGMKIIFNNLSTDPGLERGSNNSNISRFVRPFLVLRHRDAFDGTEEEGLDSLKAIVNTLMPWDRRR